MQYQLTQEEKNRKAQIKAAIVLAQKKPKQYVVFSSTEKDKLLYILREKVDRYAGGVWFKDWITLQEIELTWGNAFPWPWRENASNSK